MLSVYSIFELASWLSLDGSHVLFMDESRVDLTQLSDISAPLNNYYTSATSTLISGSDSLFDVSCHLIYIISEMLVFLSLFY